MTQASLPRAMHAVEVDRASSRAGASAVLACAAAILMLDGFDIQVIGFAAPALVDELAIPQDVLAPALAASLIGMAIGAASIGAIGDRWGRRPALILSVGLFGIATLFCATASGVWTLAAWRLMTGIGLGGALPTATALIAESAPPRWRSQAISCALVGVPLGGMLGALLAAQIIPVYGWRSIFLAGGTLPLVAAACMYFVLPESPRFRAAPTRRVPWRALFADDLRRDTLAASCVFLTNIFAVYAFFNWAPLVMTGLGFDLRTAVRGAMVFNLAGIAGTLAIAWCIARFGSRRSLTVAATTAAITLACMSAFSVVHGGIQRDWQPGGLMGGMAVAGATINAIQVGMYAVSAHIYPLHSRSAGIGWALGAGRLGGIASSFAGGVLLAHSGAAGFFAGIGAVLLLTVLAVLRVQRHIAPLEVMTINRGDD